MEGLITVTGGSQSPSWWYFKVDQDNVTGHIHHNTSCIQHNTVGQCTLCHWTATLLYFRLRPKCYNHWTIPESSPHMYPTHTLFTVTSLTCLFTCVIWMEFVVKQTPKSIKRKSGWWQKFTDFKCLSLPSTYLNQRDTDLSSPYRYPTHCSGKHKKVDFFKKSPWFEEWIRDSVTDSSSYPRQYDFVFSSTVFCLTSQNPLPS
jgi:hypothetical protein